MSESDSISSPNDDSGQRDSGSDSSSGLRSRWMLRLTPQEMYTFEEVVTYLSQYFDRFLVCEEKHPKLHFHCILDPGPDFEELHDGDVRGIIKAFLDSYWPIKAKGWGIAQYHLQCSTNPSKAMSYTLKQKSKKYFTGFSEQEIEAFVALSFPKNDRTTFVEKFRELKKNFQESEMTILDFMSQFGILKSQYDQMVNPAHAYQYALSAQVKRDNHESYNIMARYLKSLEI